jgi:protein TonB
MNLSLLRLRLHGISGASWLATLLASLLASLVAALLAACSSPPPTPAPAPPAPPHKVELTPPTSPVPGPERNAASSWASTAREYRQDAAHHLYKLNSDRIYKGRLPPMLYAIGVLDVELDRQGRVMSTHWKRAPNHAPEVMAEIEKTVRQAAPYPAPTRMGKVVYTDVWLWHKNGRFQLDTLTEGQD